MSLLVSGSTSEGIRLASFLHTVPWDNTVESWYGWYYLDPIGVFLSGSVIPVGVNPPRRAVGYGSTEETIDITVTGYSPRNERYKGGMDEWRFGMGIFPLSVPSRPSVRAEREVIHTSYRGSAVSGTSSSGAVMGDKVESSSLWGVVMPQRFAQTRFITRLSYDGSWSLAPRDSQHYVVRPMTDVLNVLSHITTPVFTLDSHPGGPHGMVMDSLVWSVDQNGLSIEISGSLRLWAFGVSVGSYDHPGFCSIPFSESVYIRFLPESNSQFPGDYGLYDLEPRARMTLLRTMGSLFPGDYPYSVPTPFSDLVGVEMFHNLDLKTCALEFLDLPGKLVSRVDDGFHTHYSIINIDRALDDFIHEVQSDFGNLLPGCFYSSAAAIERHVELLKANNIENLASLQGLASLIPDIALFFKAISQAKSFNLLGAGVSLLDLWSEVQLQWDFGIKPAISDVTELSLKYDDVVSSLRNQEKWGEFTLYGGFPFHLPAGSLGRESVSVNYRSKLRVTFAHASLLGTMLDLSSVGLLPSMSSLWDLVPFSFVVDWGYNIGDRLKDIEVAALMLQLQCHFSVHSICLTTPLSEEELSRNDLHPNSIGDDVPSIRYYIRMPSLRLPRLGAKSSYDFRSAHGPSSLFTAGALAYQLST